MKLEPWSNEHHYMMEEIWDVNVEWNWHQWIWGEYYADQRKIRLASTKQVMEASAPILKEFDGVFKILAR